MGRNSESSSYEEYRMRTPLSENGEPALHLRFFLLSCQLRYGGAQQLNL